MAFLAGLSGRASHSHTFSPAGSLRKQAAEPGPPARPLRLDLRSGGPDSATRFRENVFWFEKTSTRRHVAPATHPALRRNAGKTLKVWKRARLGFPAEYFGASGNWSISRIPVSRVYFPIN